MTLFPRQETPSGRFMGYIMGKAEGLGEDWHGHVTALTVAPEFRRIGLAHHLMNELEARFNLSVFSRMPRKTRGSP
jgi:N-terminal acetyltransferase B complex catalytic subunit